MFGFNHRETENLRTRFRNIPQEDRVWECVEEFIKWARDSGYAKGLHLRKHNEEMPHGPDNSFWLTANAGELKTRFLNQMKKGSVFCRSCEKDCPRDGRGCKEWREYFRLNWNENIHVPKPKPVVQERPMVFQYEHPDLVREGIEWQQTSQD